MNFLAHLETKRDGKPLTPVQIQEIVAAYTAGKIPDYQMAAFLMAVYFRGLDRTETRDHPGHAGFGRGSKIPAGPSAARR